MHFSWTPATALTVPEPGFADVVASASWDAESQHVFSLRTDFMSKRTEV